MHFLRPTERLRTVHGASHYQLRDDLVEYQWQLYGR
jgi:hypothetical protein